MHEATHDSIPFPAGDVATSPSRDLLTQIVTAGARQMLIRAVEAEAAQWIADRQHLVDDTGHRHVVRNGHAPPSTIVTGVGPMQVKMPRVNDRRPEPQKERFTSAILPPYLRKAKAIEELIPWHYLKGVSTGDFAEALQALLGPDCPGLAATTVTRLVSQWQDEHHDWSQRDLSDKRYVYVWADGIHFNIRLEEDRQCVLVLMGATPDGRKELIAVQDGHRESEQSWMTMLLELKHRGLEIAPNIATADGALGFCAALRKVWPTTREQRCWVHVNVLDRLPKRLQPAAKDQLHQIWMAPTRKEAERAFDLFIATYQVKYEGAVEQLAKDRDVLLAFHDFPAEHWIHLRTTNPIESTFATVRLRHKKTPSSQGRDEATDN